MPKKHSAKKEQARVLDPETILESITEDNSLIYKHDQSELSNHFQKMLDEQFSQLQEN